MVRRFTTVKWIGCTKKNSTYGATTSGRPDSKKIAYLQMNETEVPRYPLTDWIPNHAAVDWQRYPQPGDPNPNVHLAVVPAHGGKPIWIKIPFHEGDDYAPRFGWVDGKTRLGRSADSAITSTWRFSLPTPITVNRVSCSKSSDEKFLDESYDMTVSDGAIVLTSWSDGHNHIYLVSLRQRRGRSVRRCRSSIAN